jgi:hypothetical protein
VSEDGRGDVLARHLGQLGSELSLLKGKDERLCIQQCSQSWHFSIASFAIIFLPISPIPIFPIQTEKTL